MTNMIVQRTKDEVVIRLPKSINTNDLQDMLDYLKHRMATQNSKASQQDADDLAKKAKEGRWARTRKRIGL